VTKYPESQYSADARQRMIYLRNILADHELHVAQFYVKRGAFVAAINRAKYIIEKLPQSNATAEALAILVRTYKRLGMHYLSNESLSVLQLNYPEHPLSRTSSGKSKS
jgi:outer membrane protein assembly factor BamD